jgi:Mg2+ and Co2+ transporter CorA
MSNEQIALIEYSKEISPRIRTIQAKKDVIKDFIESDDKAQELKAAVKESQEALKAYVESDDYMKEIQEEIDALTKELKQALKAASSASDFKPAELKAFFVARNKEDGVKKVVDKAEVFEAITETLGE